MKQERVILSFIMVLIGLLVAGAAFYFYETSKTITPNKETSKNALLPTPTPTSAFFLTVESPGNETISGSKTVKINGKTNPNATVAILTPSDQEIVKPSSQGDFSTTMQIDEGVNYIRIVSMAPNGQNVAVERVVSYTTEDF